MTTDEFSFIEEPAVHYYQSPQRVTEVGKYGINMTPFQNTVSNPGMFFFR